MLALAGCGGDGEDPARTVEDAAQRTLDAKTSQIGVRASIYVQGLGTLKLRGDGRYDFAAERGELDVRIGGLPGASTLSSATFRYVFDRSILYLRFPDALRDTWPQGKRWARYDSSRAAPGARSFDQFFQSPKQQVEMLTSLRPDVAEVGHERVRGADTTRYQAKVDLRGAYESMRAKLKRDTLPVVVWVDGNGRVRRVLFSFRAEAGQTAATTTMTLELHSFGTPVSVEPPLAADVADLTAS